ncbi:cytochrome P450 [Xylariomycetidae sp. FL2044]|nr:cytochrome P450 [Xylariomycetidae sp. FL2044]
MTVRFQGRIEDRETYQLKLCNSILHCSITAGTMVLYSAYSLHQRPDIYGLDAEIFRAERWEGPNLRSQDMTHHGWNFKPFGGRPRFCLRMDFAVTEAAYTVVRMLQRFANLRLADD